MRIPGVDDLIDAYRERQRRRERERREAEAAAVSKPSMPSQPVEEPRGANIEKPQPPRRAASRGKDARSANDLPILEAALRLAERQRSCARYRRFPATLYLKDVATEAGLSLPLNEETRQRIRRALLTTEAPRLEADSPSDTVWVARPAPYGSIRVRPGRLARLLAS